MGIHELHLCQLDKSQVTYQSFMFSASNLTPCSISLGNQDSGSHFRFIRDAKATVLPGADVVLLGCSILMALDERCTVQDKMEVADKHVGKQIQKGGGDDAAKSGRSEKCFLGVFLLWLYLTCNMGDWRGLQLVKFGCALERTMFPKSESKSCRNL